jgi:hypothetical protein
LIPAWSLMALASAWERLDIIVRSPSEGLDYLYIISAHRSVIIFYAYSFFNMSCGYHSPICRPHSMATSPTTSSTTTITYST